MGRYGNLKNKKDIEYVLGTGFSYLKEVVKNYDGESKEKLFNELDNLRKVLYNEGRILAITKAVKFEKTLNNIEGKLEKLFSKNDDSMYCKECHTESEEVNDDDICPNCL